MLQHQDHFALIIVGPTASGKTALADCLAQHAQIEVINIDIAQCYRSFAIGTAKPDLSHVGYPVHLFDLVDTPVDINACHYRALVAEKIAEITQRGALPVIVGGSHFYVRSLFFPPHQVAQVRPEASEKADAMVESFAQENLWMHLHAVDPVRAEQLHIHDSYRLQRALKIWYSTRQKPSQMHPSYKPLCSAHIIALIPDRTTLRSIIEERTSIMLEHGWVQEAEVLMGTPWESFITRKGFIGYDALFAWIRDGKQDCQKETLKKIIVQETAQYAKRQVLFLKKVLKDLEEHQHTEHHDATQRERVSFSTYDSYQAAYQEAGSIIVEKIKRLNL